MDQKVNRNFNLTTLRRHYTDPHEIYDALREHDRIYFDASSQSWLVTGHKEITTILGDTRFTSGLGASPSQQTPSMKVLYNAVGKQFLFMDGEAHQKAQSVILKPLALKVKKMPAVIRLLVHEIIVGLRGKKEIDIVNDIAAPVSRMAIAHVMGLPTHDQALLIQLESWSDTLGNLTSGYFKGDIRDVTSLDSYFRKLISERRHAPPSDDILSSLIEARDIFTNDELVANCLMVFGAGRSTMKKLLGNGLPELFHQWDQHQAEIQEDPALIKLIGEEMLRFVTPTRYLIRQASEDIYLAQFSGNHFIRRGEKVLLFLEAGNYDPACFPHPEQFNPHRRPNKHIAFGFGQHQCPGATLSRLELQIVLEVLLTLTSLRAKPGARPTWNANPNLGGFTSCPALLQVKS